MIFVFLRDPCASMERVQLAEVEEEAGRNHVDSNGTGPGQKCGIQ